MKLETIRHSLAHVMAYAVQELFPKARFGIGPAIENGFYYDFDLPRSLTPDDLSKIEERMKEIVKENITFRKKKISKEKAKEIFKDQLYKLELIEELPEKEVSIYELEKFIDLCKGPHVKSTKEINPESFKLTKIAGAYWRGSENRPMLTRIYGVAFETKKELERYFSITEEAEKRDHRTLGQKLEIFSFDEEVGVGIPLWHPKGALLIKVIEDFVTSELTKHGYQMVRTFHIGKEDLFKTSGHLEFYRENMYSPIEIENERYYLKPMNCPFHLKIYKSKIRSYKNLPIKLAEFGTVYRYEKSGVLHGLIRVRGFTIDDAHIWCTPEQLSEALLETLSFALKILKTFGFENLNLYLATRPEKYVGILKMWQKAEKALKYALSKSKIKYKTDLGGGAFYGPKIDIKVMDSLEREWQLTTIQVDFNLPERFGIYYVDKKGRKQRPIMIHRALLGSLERFIGLLLEYYAGALPLWLSPEQIWVIPVGSRHEKYGKEINKKMEEIGMRSKLKDENETVSKKIRDGEIQRIPYLLVVGDKEMKKKSVRVRERKKGDIGLMKFDDFLKKVKMEIEKKK